jgi:hypothetical protein
MWREVLEFPGYFLFFGKCNVSTRPTVEWTMLFPYSLVIFIGH